MNEYSLSFGVGGEANRDHNSRRNVPIHADKDRIKYNSFIERDPEMVINQLYGEEIKKYNQRQIDQKHPSRQIKNLYKETKNKYLKATLRDKAIGKVYDKKAKTFKETTQFRDRAKCPEKEIIVMIGNRREHPDDKICKQILAEYVKNFQKNNKNLFITGAYIHMDEDTPHLHLDVVYKALSQKTIMKQYSFENALGEEGFTKSYNKSQGRTITAFEKWMYRERGLIEEICKKYEISLKPTVRGERQIHLSKEEYIAKQKQKEIALEQQSLNNKQKKIYIKSQQLDAEAKSKQERNDRLDREAKSKQQRNNQLDIDGNNKKIRNDNFDKLYRQAIARSKESDEIFNTMFQITKESQQEHSGGIESFINYDRNEI